MRLSMWILVDWLKKYHPQPEIKDGNRILQNVRLFSEDRKLSRTTVYLSETEDHKILCINGHDILILSFDDINQVFNDILDAFEYYNEWANTLHEAVISGYTAQQLLKAGSAALDYHFILADATFLPYEQYSSEELAQKDGQVPAKELLPLDILLPLNAQPQIRLAGIKPYPVPIANDSAHNAARNLFVEGLHQGWLVVIKLDGDFTSGELDLIDELGSYIEHWLKDSQLEEKKLAKSGLFLDLLEERSLNREQLEQRLEAFQWFPTDPKQVYVFNLSENKNSHYAFDGFLKHLSQHTFSLYFHDSLLLIVNHALTDIGKLEQELRQLLSLSGFAAGKSPVFTNIFQLKACFLAARIAAQYTQMGDSGITDYSQVRLPYILSVLREHSLVDVRHPALAVLKAYDKKHEAHLYDTLRVFLENERNYTATAQALIIHRSTLLYRISRIQELTQLDLDSFSIRLLLLLSYQLEGESP